MTLKIETRQANGVTVISCQGRIVFGEEATELRENLKRVLASTARSFLTSRESTISTAAVSELWWACTPPRVPPAPTSN